MPVKRALLRLRRRFAALVRAREGVALIEFAYSLPIMITLGFGGLELAMIAGKKEQGDRTKRLCA